MGNWTRIRTRTQRKDEIFSDQCHANKIILDYRVSSIFGCPASAHIKVRLCEASKRPEKNENHVVYPKLRNCMSDVIIGLYFLWWTLPRDSTRLCWTSPTDMKIIMYVTDGHECNEASLTDIFHRTRKLCKDKNMSFRTLHED